MTESGKQSIVVVLGLKRGGTSITASILSHLGIVMGERFPAPETWNPGGFFEDLEFVDVMDRVGKGARFHEGKIVSCQRPQDLTAYDELIKRRNSSYRAWGLKNFLINYLLPDFESRCHPIPVYALRVERPFAEAVESWTIRQQTNFDNAMSEQAHLLYNTDKVYTRHKGPKMSVSYHELLASPRAVIGRMAEWLGIPFVSSAVELVKPSYKHF